MLLSNHSEYKCNITYKLTKSNNNIKYWCEHRYHTLNILDVISLARNEPWPESDEDYTTSTDTIHAVWATLRHESYNWAVIEEAGEYACREVIAPQEPCQHPLAIKCGNTGNFIYGNSTKLRKVVAPHRLRHLNLTREMV